MPAPSGRSQNILTKTPPGNAAAKHSAATDLQLLQLSNELWAEDIHPSAELQASQARGRYRQLDPV